MKKHLPEKFRQAILNRTKAMEDGDYYDIVCDALIEHGFKFKTDIEFHPHSGCRGKRFALEGYTVDVSHAHCMGEFTDLQFV